MCQEPRHLRDGTLARCRKCWQCKRDRIDGWVGRCIAESRTCEQAIFVTLTYGRDEFGNESHERAAILTYSDVQKFVKNMRKRGLKFRYIVTGEVGSEKGRTHWHIILFLEEKLPETQKDFGRNSWHRAKREVPVDVPQLYYTRYNNPLWPHGFSQWDPLHYGYERGGVRYACKYINKDVDDPEAQSKLAMSTQPPIGFVYFERLAKRMVEEGVAPQDPYYRFPNHARRWNGQVIWFKLENRSSELFRENYILEWRGLPKPWGMQGPPVYTGRPWHYPASEYVEEHEDKLYSDVLDNDPDFVEWYHGYKAEREEAIKAKGYEQWLSDETEIKEVKKQAFLTRKEWLQALSNRVRVHAGIVHPLFVVWLHQSEALGRYKKAKVQPSKHSAVWLKSQSF